MTCECGKSFPKMKYTIPSYEVRDCRTYIIRRRVCRECHEAWVSRGED